MPAATGRTTASDRYNWKYRAGNRTGILSFTGDETCPIGNSVEGSRVDNNRISSGLRIIATIPTGTGERGAAADTGDFG